MLKDIKSMMPVAQNVLSRITSALGLNNIRFSTGRINESRVETAIDVTRSVYKAVIPKFLYKPPY